MKYSDFILLPDSVQQQRFTIMMLLALLLIVSYGCLAESQPPNSSIPIHTPPTILDSDSSCPIHPSSDIIDKELRKTKNIINSNYQLLRPCKCGGPGWIRVLYFNVQLAGQLVPVLAILKSRTLVHPGPPHLQGHSSW